MTLRDYRCECGHTITDAYGDVTCICPSCGGTMRDACNGGIGARYRFLDRGASMRDIVRSVRYDGCGGCEGGSLGPDYERPLRDERGDPMQDARRWSSRDALNEKNDRAYHSWDRRHGYGRIYNHKRSGR